jgi:hypothetical protein
MCNTHRPGGMFCDLENSTQGEPTCSVVEHTALEAKIEKMKEQLWNETGGCRQFVDCYRCKDISIYNPAAGEFSEEGWFRCGGCSCPSKYTCPKCFAEDGWGAVGYSGDVCSRCLKVEMEYDRDPEEESGEE